MRSLAAAMLLGAGLASCSQDDFADKPQGGPLPDGEYPLTLIAQVDGMVTRTVVPDGKVKVEYSLTDKGRSIIPVLRSLAEWGAQHQCIKIIVPQHDMVSHLTDLDCNASSAGSVELAKEYTLPGAED